MRHARVIAISLVLLVMLVAFTASTQSLQSSAPQNEKGQLIIGSLLFYRAVCITEPTFFEDDAGCPVAYSNHALPGAQGSTCPDIPNKGKAGTWAQNARINVNIDPRFRTTNPGLVDAIKRAFTNWALASGMCHDTNDSGVMFTFSENPPPSSADVLAGRVPANTYQVIREIASGANPSFPAVTGPPVAVGTTVRTYAFTFVNPGEVTPDHLFEVMVHEIGHTFSLSDCCTPEMPNCDRCPPGTTVMRLPHGMDGPTACDNAVIHRVGQYQGQRPPAGERRTYRLVGTAITSTIVTERVNELVAGHVVYRIHVVGDPPSLGEYIGCDAMYGEVEVATDWWDLDDPSQNMKHIFEPPIFRCPYGSPVDRVCQWAGMRAEGPARQVTRVLAYETVTVPYGTFQNTMKLIVMEHEENVDPEDVTLLLWIDRRIGIIKAQDVDSGDTIELVAYSPPVGKDQAPSDGLDGEIYPLRYTFTKTCTANLNQAQVQEQGEVRRQP